MTSSVGKFKHFKLTVFGFFQVFLYLLMGEGLGILLPLPPAIIGLVICYSSCLVMKKVPLSLNLASNFLLKHMAIFFIPYVVTITLFWPLLATHWLACLLALFISTLVTLSVTCMLSDKLIDIIEKDSLNGEKK